MYRAALNGRVTARDAMSRSSSNASRARSH